MPSAKRLLLTVSVVCFVLSAFGIPAASDVMLVRFGLAFLATSFIV